MKNQLFKPEGIEEIFEKWKKVLDISLGETGIIWWFPRSDGMWRLECFKEYLEDFHCKYQLIDLQNIFVEDDIELKKLNVNDKIILTGTKSLIHEKKNLFYSILQFNRSNQNGMLIFCEDDDLNGNIEIFTNEIEQNNFFYPLYSKAKSHNFIKYLGEKWNLSIKNDDCEKIYQHVGGHLWLVKEIVRQIKIHDKTIDQALRSSELNQKAEKIFIHIKDLVNQPVNQDTVNIFTKYNFYLENTRDIPNIFEKIKKNSNNLKIKNADIYSGEKNISHFFSPQEKKIIIHSVAQKNNYLFSREEIARVIWNDNENYEEWSLDQIIYRLRKKIKKHSLNIDFETKRGVGYIYKKN